MAQLYACNLIIFNSQIHIRTMSSNPKFDYENYTAKNEPMPDYAPGSKDRQLLEETLAKYEGKVEDIPIVIGDKEIRTDQVKYQVCVSITRLIKVKIL